MATHATRSGRSLEGDVSDIKKQEYEYAQITMLIPTVFSDFPLTDPSADAA
jgi:hypothetical protein